MKSIGGQTMRKLRNKQEMSMQTIIMSLLKSVIIGYIVTTVFIFLFAYFVYKYELSDQYINIAVIVMMIIATFITGFSSAKWLKNNRWMYGAISGIIYFVILIVVALLFNKDNAIASEVVTVFLICLGGGMLGGMIG